MLLEGQQTDVPIAMLLGPDIKIFNQYLMDNLMGYPFYIQGI